MSNVTYFVAEITADVCFFFELNLVNFFWGLFWDQLFFIDGNTYFYFVIKTCLWLIFGVVRFRPGFIPLQLNICFDLKCSLFSTRNYFTLFLFSFPTSYNNGYCTVRQKILQDPQILL